MTAVAVELLARPPVSDAGPDRVPALDPNAIEVIADTDKLMTMCNCSESSDNPY
jgi:hypothetical protein